MTLRRTTMSNGLSDTRERLSIVMRNDGGSGQGKARADGGRDNDSMINMTDNDNATANERRTSDLEGKKKQREERDRPLTITRDVTAGTLKLFRRRSTQLDPWIRFEGSKLAKK
jgi:hypothetical protein